MKHIHSVFLFLCAVFSGVGCGGQVDDAQANVSPETNPLACAPNESPRLSVSVIGPADGEIEIGSRGALFLTISVELSCGKTDLTDFTVHLDSEFGAQSSSLCHGSCDSNPDSWSFQHPTLTPEAGAGEESFFFVDPAKGVTAAFYKPLSIEAGRKNLFHLRLDIASKEFVPGSLIGYRFHAYLGDVTVQKGVLIALDPQIRVIGGHQKIVSVPLS